MIPRYLLILESGEPADPMVVVCEHEGWEVSDRFTASDGSRWRILDIETELSDRAAQDFEAIWTVAPMD